MRHPILILMLLVFGAAGMDPARAETPAQFQAGFEVEARQQDSGFKGFSAQRGETFFGATHGSEWSCASCHTRKPTDPGRHAKTGKDIAPLAPSANPQRFTSASKVEKWFRRNCNDVLGRPCSAREKGDVLAYLLSLRK